MTGFRVVVMHAFLAIDPEDPTDTEGLIAFTGSDGLVYPLVCADEARVATLRPIARTLAQERGVKITLARFSVREDVEVIE